MPTTIDQTTGEISNETNELIPLSEVAHFLATKPPIETAKELRDRLAALCQYYRKSVDQYNEMYEGQLRTERYIGQVLAELPRQQGARPPDLRGDTMSPQEIPTLQELGFDKKQSSRLQQLAAVPEDQFNTFINNRQQAHEKITKTDLFDYVLAPNLSDRINYNGDEWKTPIKWIEAARSLYDGVIDLDPASSDQAQQLINATDYYTKEDDGLTQDWYGTIWCNPPYSTDLIKAFAEKAIVEYQRGHAKQLLLLVNNCTDTQWFMRLASHYPVMFSRGRVSFWYDNPNDETPTRQGQAIFYLGPNSEQFYVCFQHLAYKVQ